MRPREALALGVAGHALLGLDPRDLGVECRPTKVEELGQVRRELARTRGCQPALDLLGAEARQGSFRLHAVGVRAGVDVRHRAAEDGRGRANRSSTQRVGTGVPSGDNTGIDIDDVGGVGWGWSMASVLAREGVHGGDLAVDGGASSGGGASVAIGPRCMAWAAWAASIRWRLSAPIA